MKIIIDQTEDNDAVSKTSWIEQNDQYQNWPEKGKEYHFPTDDENWHAQKILAIAAYILIAIGIGIFYVYVKYYNNEWVQAAANVGGVAGLALGVGVVLYSMIEITRATNAQKRNKIQVVPSTAFGLKQFLFVLIFAAIVICGLVSAK